MGKRSAELLTEDIEIDIDEAFLVNVRFLRKVLKTISSEKNKWWVEKELAESVVFGHRGTDDPEMPQVAPLLIRYPKTSAGMVCLHWTAWNIVQKGQYTYNGRTVGDPAEVDRYFQLCWRKASHTLIGRKGKKREWIRQCIGDSRSKNAP